MSADFTPEKRNYKILPPFKMQVLTNFPYIEADFDALTNYQLLCKVVEYLNMVIHNENELTEEVEGLYNAYVSLQNYVNNYFDNLDVQDEINNKLDEMAESGQLTDIIAQYLGLAGMITFNTVSEMKLAQNLVNGSKCATLGYNEVNDGGAAFYKIRTITNDDVVDNKYIIEVYDNLLIAELILNETINIKQLGLTEETADIGADINTITNIKNKIAYVPYGSYNVTTTIHPETNKTIIIDGSLTYTGNDTCILINTPRNIIKTKNITSSGYCLTFENDGSSSQCQNNNIELNGILESSSHCLYFHSINMGVCYNYIKFNTLRAGSSSYCIYIKTESSGTYSRFVAESTIKGGQCGSGLYAIYIDTGTTGGTGEVTGMHFETISCEGVTNAIFIKNARGNNFDYIRIGEVSGTYLKLDSNARNNIFNILSPVTHDKIDLTTSSTNANHINIMNAPFSASGGLVLASKMILARRKISLQQLVNRAYKNVTTSPYVMSNDEARYYINITNNESTVTLNEYYGVNGINEFWVISSRTFTLQDKDETTICTGTAGATTYKFHCICYDQDGTEKWFVIKSE